jgi:hypothetical protein
MRQNPTVKHIWYKPRGYTHLTSKLYLKDLPFVSSYVSNPENILRHKFQPLIHRILTNNKLKNVEWSENKKHFTKDSITGERMTTAKFRQIYYASHLDSHIYSYYCNKILSPLYEDKLTLNKSLSDCICAYRRIPLINQNRKKCNIDFANDVFQLIKRKDGELVAMSFDIKSFFDTLNHKLLKKAWINLLDPQSKSLPKDHYKIFRSITKFVFVEFVDLLKEFEIKHPEEIYEKEIKNILNSAEEIKSNLINNGLLRINPFRSLEKEMVGIPQGTPISAFLANLYMLEFDNQIHEEVVVKMNGIYKRYSDDIIVVCTPEQSSIVESLILKTISDSKLIIQKDKTQKAFFNENGRLLKGSKPLQYLGFEYNGNSILLKSSSVSKFYRKMKRNIHYRAYMAMNSTNVNSEIFKKKIYKGFSHYGSRAINPKKRNYFTYAYTASRVMNEPAIKKQLTKSWVVLNNELKRYSIKYKIKSNV